LPDTFEIALRSLRLYPAILCLTQNLLFPTWKLILLNSQSRLPRQQVWNVVQLFPFQSFQSFLLSPPEHVLFVHGSCVFLAIQLPSWTFSSKLFHSHRLPDTFEIALRSLRLYPAILCLTQNLLFPTWKLILLNSQSRLPRQQVWNVVQLFPCQSFLLSPPEHIVFVHGSCVFLEIQLPSWTFVEEVAFFRYHSSW